MTSKALIHYCGRHMLSVLIENVILEVRQEKLLITNVSINVSLSSKQKKTVTLYFLRDLLLSDTSGTIINI